MDHIYSKLFQCIVVSTVVAAAIPARGSASFNMTLTCDNGYRIHQRIEEYCGSKAALENPR